MAAILRTIGGLPFDAVFEESHRLDLEITDNPIENGSIISDHAFMSPVSLTIRAGVSDTRLFTFFSDPYGDGKSRSVRCYELLTELQRAAEPFNVQTGLKLYRNMVCVGIEIDQDKQTANCLIFRAHLREVIIVNTQTVKYKSKKVKENSDSTGTGDKTSTDKHATPKEGETSRQASPTTNRGNIKGSEVQDKGVGATAKTSRKSSLLKKMTGVLGL